MSCINTHRAYRQSVCSQDVPDAHATWGSMVPHALPPLTNFYAGDVVPPYRSYPSWFLHHLPQPGYTVDDWHLITSMVFSLLSRYSATKMNFEAAGVSYTFPSSFLLLLAGPMSGNGDPHGTIARRILRWITESGLFASIPDIPLFARILAHGWLHPAITDDMMQWCVDRFETFWKYGFINQDLQLATHVIGLGAEIPEIRDRIPDDLIVQMISMISIGGETTQHYQRQEIQKVRLPILRSLITNLAHRRPVAEWIQRVMEPPQHGMQFLVEAIATMGSESSIPDHVGSLMLRLLDTPITSATVDMAAQWMVNPAYRPAVEAFLDRATTTPYRTMVLSALARAPYTGVWFHRLPLVEQSLVSGDSLQSDAAIQVLCHWMQDGGASAFLLDRIMDFVRRTEYPMERLIPVMARSYRTLARTGAMLDPRVIDTMLHHCQTYYDLVRVPIAETLGGLMEDGTPDAAERALHVCRALITPWDVSRDPLMTALFRGLAGPCAQEVSDTLMSLVSIPGASSAMLDALISIPSTDRGRQYRDMIAARVLTELSRQNVFPPRLRDMMVCAFRYLPLSSVLALASRLADRQWPEPVARLYPLIALLTYGTYTHHGAAWNACADIDVQEWFDQSIFLDAWAWGLSIAPPENASWLAYGGRHHQGLQSVLRQDRTSEA